MESPINEWPFNGDGLQIYADEDDKYYGVDINTFVTVERTFADRPDTDPAVAGILDELANFADERKFRTLIGLGGFSTLNGTKTFHYYSRPERQVREWRYNFEILSQTYVNGFDISTFVGEDLDKIGNCSSIESLVAEWTSVEADIASALEDRNRAELDYLERRRQSLITLINWASSQIQAFPFDKSRYVIEIMKKGLIEPGQAYSVYAPVDCVCLGEDEECDVCEDCTPSQYTLEFDESVLFCFDVAPAELLRIKEINERKVEIQDALAAGDLDAENANGAIFRAPAADGMWKSIEMSHRAIDRAVKENHVGEHLSPETHLPHMFKVGTKVTSNIGPATVIRVSKNSMAIQNKAGQVYSLHREEVLEGDVARAE